MPNRTKKTSFIGTGLPKREADESSSGGHSQILVPPVLVQMPGPNEARPLEDD